MRWFRRRPQLDADEVDAVVDADVTLAARLDAGERDRHRDLTVALVESKRWEAVAGMELTDAVMVTIAANAAIPVLGLDLALYRNVASIIVRPTAARSRGRRAGPVHGVVSEHPMSTIGQAAPHSGPLSITWPAALRGSRYPEAGHNVVIHEFAHKIDMSDGYTDGTPPMRGDDLTRWTEILADEYERSDSRLSDEALRPYAWTNPAEFFSVATEAFFCTPVTLRDAKPALYAALSGFYRQDPARAASAGPGS